VLIIGHLAQVFDHSQSIITRVARCYNASISRTKPLCELLKLFMLGFC
jgi:hypothetical protein